MVWLPTMLCDRGVRGVDADDATAERKIHRFNTPEHAHFDVTDAGEGQLCPAPVEACQRHHHTARGTARTADPAKNHVKRLIDMVLYVLPRRLRRPLGERPVSQTIDHRHQCALVPALDHEGITVLCPPRMWPAGGAKGQR